MNKHSFGLGLLLLVLGGIGMAAGFVMMITLVLFLFGAPLFLISLVVFGIGVLLAATAAGQEDR